MKERVFNTECRKESIVIHVTTHQSGKMVKISQDKTKALILFDDGNKAWVDYYKLELVK